VVVDSDSPLGPIDGAVRKVMTPDGEAVVVRCYVAPANCVHVTCENGASLTCSLDAPLMLGDGIVEAVDAMHKEIQTCDGLSKVVGVEWLGAQPVVAIDAGDVAFYAGQAPYILHHNKLIP